MATELPTKVTLSADQQREAFASLISEKHPELSGRSKEISEVMFTSVQGRTEQAKALKDMGVNGQTDDVLKMHDEFKRQVTIQDSVNETWLQKGWRWTKEAVHTVTTPFRWAWDTARKHPVLTALAVVGIAVGGFYLWQYWHVIASAAHEAAGTFVGGTRDALQTPSVLQGGTPMPDALTQIPGGNLSVPSPLPSGFDPGIGVGPSDLIIPPGSPMSIPTPIIH